MFRDGEGERVWLQRSIKPQTQRGVVVGMLQKLTEVRAQEQSVRSSSSKIIATADFVPGAETKRGTKDEKRPARGRTSGRNGMDRGGEDDSGGSNQG